MGRLSGATTDIEWQTAAEQLYALVRNLGNHDAARCAWKPGAFWCGAFDAGGSINFQMTRHSRDVHQELISFRRADTGLVGWFLHRSAVLGSDPGEVWHLISILADRLARIDRTLILKWTPTFKHRTGFSIYYQPDPIMSLVSDWEAGKQPFASFGMIDSLKR